MHQAKGWISQAEWMKQDTILLGMASNLGFTSCFFCCNFPLNNLDRYWPQETENSKVGRETVTGDSCTPCFHCTSVWTGWGPSRPQFHFRTRLSRHHIQLCPSPRRVPRKRFDDFQIAQSGMGGKRDDGAIWLNGLGNPRAGGFLLLALARRYIV